MASKPNRIYFPRSGMPRYTGTKVRKTLTYSVAAWNYKTSDFSLFFDNIRTTGNPSLRNNFGSLYLSVDNVIFTNGYLDAWIYHGVIYTYAPNSIAINFERMHFSYFFASNIYWQIFLLFQITLDPQIEPQSALWTQ